jgi:hypothetical protein
MKAMLVGNNVVSCCPDCDGARTTFEISYGGKEFGTVVINKNHKFKGKDYSDIFYTLMRCAGCGRGGLSKIHVDRGLGFRELESFFPFSIEQLALPPEVPKDITVEFREAELCASFGATRGASALFRSTLEKTLKANGYKKGNLDGKIDEAAADGVITEARRRRVHENIRVLGNDVLHDDWREVSAEEVSESHRYAQRVLEDLYDDRKSVETILVQKQRINAMP